MALDGDSCSNLTASYLGNKAFFEADKRMITLNCVLRPRLHVSNGRQPILPLVNIARSSKKMAAVNESDSSLAKKCFGMTKTSQMSPWPVRMVSRWRHTRWSWQLLVRSSLLCLVYAPRHQEDSPLLLKVAFAAESYSPLPPENPLHCRWSLHFIL